MVPEVAVAVLPVVNVWGVVGGGGLALARAAEVEFGRRHAGPVPVQAVPPFRPRRAFGNAKITDEGNNLNALRLRTYLLKPFLSFLPLDLRKVWSVRIGANASPVRFSVLT